MPTKTLCPKCHGQRTTSCVACRGTGKKSLVDITIGICKECNGTGQRLPVGVTHNEARSGSPQRTTAVGSGGVEALVRVSVDAAPATDSRARRDRAAMPWPWSLPWISCSVATSERLFYLQLRSFPGKR